MPRLPDRRRTRLRLRLLGARGCGPHPLDGRARSLVRSSLCVDPLRSLRGGLPGRDPHPLDAPRTESDGSRAGSPARMDRGRRADLRTCCVEPRPLPPCPPPRPSGLGTLQQGRLDPTSPRPGLRMDPAPRPETALAGVFRRVVEKPCSVIASCPVSRRPCSPRTSPTPRRHGRSEEHTSELQSRPHLVCRLLLEK